MYWLVLHGALVWQAALAVLLLAGGLLGVRRARRRIRREAGATRAGLGEPRRRIGDARDGAEVTLAGTLRASGPCLTFVDGADAVATSAGPECSPPAVDARAEKLELVLEQEGRPPPLVSEHTVAALLVLRATPAAERGVFPRDEKRLRLVARLFDVAHDVDEGVDVDAAHGDGADLANLLWREGTASESALRLVALTNRSAGGRDELLRWARWGRVTRCIGCDVATTFSDVTAHLALAEAFGDEALAAELRPVVERFRAALLRRETAVPLAIFESLPLERRLPGDQAK